MNSIIDMKKEAQELARKKSWLEKSACEMMDKLDEQVKDIKSDYEIKQKLDVNIGNDYYDKYVYLVFDTSDDDAFFIFDAFIPERNDWHGRVKISVFCSHIIRQIIEALPDALEKITEKIRVQNSKYEQTIKKVEKAITALKSNG